MRWHLALLASALLLAAAAAATALRPSASGASHPPGLLESGIPHQVDGWTLAASPLPMIDLTVAEGDGERSNHRPYDEVLMRTYADARGRSVMLALAYAAQQRQEVKIHRPDLCYPSQGWRVSAWSEQPLALRRHSGEPVNGVRMLTRRGTQLEAVVYWLRTGDSYGQAMWDGRLAILRHGLRGHLPDGMLVRASMRLEGENDAAAAYADMEGFLGGLVRGSGRQAQELLVP
jgi:EpsI family protein